MPSSFEIATREHHPAIVHRGSAKRLPSRPVPKEKLPKTETTGDVELGDRVVKMTNLNKLFWPKLGVTKRDLIQYYIDVVFTVPPPPEEWAMVMKEYPNV